MKPFKQLAATLFLYLFLSIPIPSWAGTVVVEDGVNREHLALIVDRIATDSCTNLLDCRRGTDAANMASLYSSAQAQNNPMPPAAFDPSNLTARHADTVGSADYADYADSAPYAFTAASANPGVGAFTASVIASTHKVDEAFYAEESPHFTWAKTAVNPGGYAAINAYWLNDVPPGGGPYGGKQIDTLRHEVLYPSRPVGWEIAEKATFTRTAASYYSDPTPVEWVGKTGKYTCAAWNSSGVCTACTDINETPPGCATVSGQFEDRTAY